MSETPLAAWTRCEPYIAAALAHTGGTHTLDDVREGVERGDYHFWPGARCAVVTEFQVSPRSKRLNFWLLGGDLRELRTMRPFIEAWAKEQGCVRAIGGGVAEKRGWARVLATAGYEPRWTIYSKELT